MLSGSLLHMRRLDGMVGFEIVRFGGIRITVRFSDILFERSKKLALSFTIRDSGRGGAFETSLIC